MEGKKATCTLFLAQCAVQKRATTHERRGRPIPFCNHLPLTRDWSILLGPTTSRMFKHGQEYCARLREIAAESRIFHSGTQVEATFPVQEYESKGWIDSFLQDENIAPV